jgi:hypothetical protein
MNLTTVEGTTVTSFSQSTLDLQKDFCCTDKDTRKVIRWVGCKPGVYQSSTNLFSSSDLALCSWFQEISDYNFVTISVDPKEVAFLDLDSKYILSKISWPANALESKKLMEFGICDQGGYIGMTIPFIIGTPVIPDYRSVVVKDLFHLNTVNDLILPLRINNISPYTASISFLYAK